MMNEDDLVMPFVTVASKGGPHDDDSYVAGYEVGEISGLLQWGPAGMHQQPVRTESVPQLDLVAMRFNRTMRIISESDGYSFVSFTRTHEQ